MATYKSSKSYKSILERTICIAVVVYLLGGPTPLDASNDHKCSHIPPIPDEINYVWTSIDSISDGETDLVMIDDWNQKGIGGMHDKHEDDDEFASRKTGERSANIKASLNKRHIEERPRKEFVISPGRYQIEPEPSFAIGLTRKESSNYNFFSFSQNRNDLIPMKISVYYDESVYSLEEPKSKLIREHIIPTVIKFFERALSIQREFAIDTFRITRRCANVTYAKDNNNIARPFCLNKCDDHSICGEMIVPQAHLAGCSYCNTTTRKCYTNHSVEGKGVTDTQLLLYVSAKQTHRCGREQTVAYAAHCAQDSKTDRPVAGHANLCPNSISADSKDVNSLIATVKHELTHVLGFSVSLFAYYRDQEGKPLTDRRKWTQSSVAQGQQSNQQGANTSSSTSGSGNYIGANHLPKDPKTGYPIWSDKIVKKVIRRGWVTGRGHIDKEVHLLVTPTVVREVRAHFNCSTLEGAELEDQGHDGTSMTHWEKRLFENEAMTGTHTHMSVYSRLTLAALQDTGWYVANFSVAERLYWGKDLGCDFATQSCKFWMEKQKLSNSSIAPFCDKIKTDQLQITCTLDHTAKAVCNMRKYKQPLAEFYRNFQELDGVHSNDLGFYGGTVDLADYCPYVQEYTLQQHPVINQGSRCSHSENNLLDSDKNVALEHFGPSSRCFIHGRHWTNHTCPFKRRFWPHLGAGCYKTSCNFGFISLQIHNITYNCFYKGQVLDIIQQVDHTLYNGTILCPACDMICPAKSCKQYNKIIIDGIVAILDSKSNSIKTIEDADENKHHNFNLITDERNNIDNDIIKSLSQRSLLKRAGADLGSHLGNDKFPQQHPHYSDHDIISNQAQPKSTTASGNFEKFYQEAQLVQRWLELLNKTGPYQSRPTEMISDIEEHLKVYKLMLHQRSTNLNQHQFRDSNLDGQMLCSSSVNLHDQLNNYLLLMDIILLSLASLFCGSFVQTLNLSTNQ